MTMNTDFKEVINHAARDPWATLSQVMRSPRLRYARTTGFSRHIR